MLDAPSPGHDGSERGRRPGDRQCVRVSAQRRKHSLQWPRDPRQKHDWDKTAEGEVGGRSYLTAENGNQNA